MPRVGRFNYIVENGVYHVMSRIALDRFFDDEDKTVLLRMIQHFTKIYYCNVFGFCIMGNHFHLILQMYDGSNNKDSDFKNRYKRYSKVINFIPKYFSYKPEDILMLGYVHNILQKEVILSNLVIVK